MKELKIFGGFRTGTNLVRSLLEMNYAAIVHNNNYAYKHIPVPAYFENNEYSPFKLRIVATVKDPFAFIDSTYRYCKKNNYLNIDAGDTFEEFCAQPFTVFDGGFDNFPRYRFSNPVQYWNSLYSNLRSLPNEKIALIRYEDLLIDMPGEIEKVAAKYELERKSEVFLTPKGITINLADPPRKSEDDYYLDKPFARKEYYLERQYMERFTKPQTDFIYSELDPQLLELFSYGTQESPLSTSGRKALFFHQLHAVDRGKDELSQLQADLLETRKQLINSQDQNREVSEKASSLEGQLADTANQVSALQDQLRTEKQLAEENVSALQDQLQTEKQLAEENVSALQTDLDDSTRARQSILTQLEREKASLESHQRYANSLRSDLDTAKKNYHAIRESISYKLGYDLVHAVIRPGKNTLLLPFRIIKHLGKNSAPALTDTTTDQQQMESAQENNHGAAPHGEVRLKSAKELNVACIFDQFTIEGYRHECNLIQVPVDGWEEAFSQTRPDIFIVESAWRGNGGVWEYKVGTYAGQDRSELASILQWCNENQIPTVFWNKEDPVNYDKFIDAARRFDVIFTTDVEMVPNYKQACGHDRVYPLIFSAQPQLHNPILKYDREDKACFAGTYYQNVYEERKQDMDEVLDIAQSYGLAIYDRNYERNQVSENEFSFPERFQENILGSLDYSEMDRAYKGYRFTLNVNSIKQSPTMFSRRVFESLACGTPVLSTPSLGVEKVFGDLVIMTGQNIESERVLGLLQCNDHEYQQRSLRGIREVFSKHLYHHRFSEILAKSGIEVAASPEPKVTMVCVAATESEVENIIGNFQRQAWTHKKLLIFLDQATGVEQQINKYQTEMITPIQLHSAEVLELSLADLVDTKYVSFIKPEHYYGPYFLTDLMQASIYSEAQVIGKESRYSILDGSLNLAPGRDYQFIQGPLNPTSAVIDLDVISTLTSRSVCTVVMEDQLPATATGSSIRAFSVNQWNFIANAQLGGAKLHSEELRYVSL